MTLALRLGTRESPLALAQARVVAEALAEFQGVAVELVPIRTHGDASTASLSTLGGTGAFATAIREALVAGECDFAVHSLKDLPTATFPGLTIAAIPAREDARDALCSRGSLALSDLAPGARVGSGSPRRAAQVRMLRPDLTVVDIRGNVDSRLARVAGPMDVAQRLDAQDLDGVVLAVAGLARLARLGDASEVFDLVRWPTAPGQGALALEARRGEDDAGVRRQLALLDHWESSLTSRTERAVLAGLEAGCSAPVGVTASVNGSRLSLRAVVYALDGTRVVVDEGSWEAAAAGAGGAREAWEAGASALATSLVEALFAAGAADIAALHGAA